MLTVCLLSCCGGVTVGILTFQQHLSQRRILSVIPLYPSVVTSSHTQHRDSKQGTQTVAFSTWHIKPMGCKLAHSHSHQAWEAGLHTNNWVQWRYYAYFSYSLFHGGRQMGRSWATMCAVGRRKVAFRVVGGNATGLCPPPVSSASCACQPKPAPAPSVPSTLRARRHGHTWASQRPQPQQNWQLPLQPQVWDPTTHLPPSTLTPHSHNSLWLGTVLDTVCI